MPVHIMRCLSYNAPFLATSPDDALTSVAISYHVDTVARPLLVTWLDGRFFPIYYYWKMLVVRDVAVSGIKRMRTNPLNTSSFLGPHCVP